MTVNLNIVKDGDKIREYSFQTLEEEEEEEIAELLLSQLDMSIHTLHSIGAIRLEDPPESNKEE